MSNLNLPELTFDALKAYVLKGRNKTSRTVANNTVAYLYEADSTNEIITVEHHGSTIATLTPYSLTVTNANYDSASTRERVNGFLSSNNTGLYVAQRNHEQVLFDRNQDDKRLTEDFTILTFNTEHGYLELVNGLTPEQL